MEQQQIAYSQVGIQQQVLPILRHQGRSYHKQRNVFARIARRAGQIETHTSDGKETVNRVRRGGFIGRNQTGAGETYVLTPEKFQVRYEWLRPGKGGFDEYCPIGHIIAVELNRRTLEALGVSGDFTFVAPWGEPMIAKPGDFLASPPDFSEVYRIARKEFFETYAED